MLYFFVSCSFLCVFFFIFSQLFPKLNAVEKKSMSNNNSPPQIKYDVFVSFRGEDIRDGFLSHLTEAFDLKKVNAFVDHKLEKGEELWPSLVAAIEASSISLIIFSPDYASSPWCLKELVNIHECKDKYGHIVIPVFYHVKPTDVRHQSSDGYRKAFAEHARNHKNEVQLWRHVFKNSADLSGFESSKLRNDADLLKAIVDLVLTRLGKSPVNSKGLVGMHKRIEDVESLIHKESENARLIGLWGMGGIGKTTLAEEVFNKLRSKYEGSYFLANEREQSGKHGKVSLKKDIFSALLGNVKIDTPNSLPEDIVRRIRRMKVLIVLDDVNDSDHIEDLLGGLHNFGSGSSIIVTTRDEQVLKANNADETYHLQKFTSDEALKLFNLHAFNQSVPQREYDELSQRIIHYAKGLPLILKVLAHRLHGKNEEVWESELYKLRKVPPTKVYDVMKPSYDDLDRKEKQVFLDLACFVCRSRKKITVGYLKYLLKDGEGDNSVIVALERLKDKALITFSEDDVVCMHDSIQEMAWEIVRLESTEDPGNRSRLWDPDDIYEALKNDKVSEAIRSIQIDLPTLKEQKLMPHIFAKMSRLRFVEIYGKDDYDCYSTLIPVAEGLQFLATEVRFLCWEFYPLKSLPEKFSGEKLVILKLELGGMEKLWDGVKNLVNLKELDLRHSHHLKELPNLSKATNIEVLCLRGCYRLTSVHPSVFSLAKLEILDLCGCESLAMLATDIHLCRLSYLNLDQCESLTEFSLISDNLKELRLEFTRMKALPSSFGHQRKLQLLNLSFSRFERLPSSFANLTQLRHLDISSCCWLLAIPELPLSLETLYAAGCLSLKTVLFHSTAVEQLKEKRKQVLFFNCRKLDEHSLEAIGLNMRINVIKFANQHLSAPKPDDFQNYNDYEKNYLSYQAFYGYPGSSVPEWFEYKSTKYSVIIDLSSSPPSPVYGFILCFVLLEKLDKLEYSLVISDCEGKGIMESVKIKLSNKFCYVGSHEVVVMYDQRCSNFVNNIARNLTRFKIKVRGPRKDNGISYRQPPVFALGGFGVSIVRTSTYSGFMKQMELCDSTYHLH